MHLYFYTSEGQFHWAEVKVLAGPSTLWIGSGIGSSVPCLFQLLEPHSLHSLALLPSSVFKACSVASCFSVTLLLFLSNLPLIRILVITVREPPGYLKILNLTAAKSLLPRTGAFTGSRQQRWRFKGTIIWPT